MTRLLLGIDMTTATSGITRRNRGENSTKDDSEIGKRFLARDQAADLEWACDETLASLVSPGHVQVAFFCLPGANAQRRRSGKDSECGENPIIHRGYSVEEA